MGLRYAAHIRGLGIWLAFGERGNIIIFITLARDGITLRSKVVREVGDLQWTICE